MSEQHNGFTIRRDNGKPAGYPPDHIHFCETSKRAKALGVNLPIVESVLYIGPDAPQWRERPTCAGWWIEYVAGKPRRIIEIVTVNAEWPGQWFGPLPNSPEVTQ